MSRVTIKDIAKAAGVSFATVSRALSGSPEIGEETRRRIVEISREMNYTPNTVARSLVARKTGIFGLIVSGINNPFMSEIAYHVELRSREKGYNLMLCNSSGDPVQEEEIYRLFIGRQVDGIIVIPSNMSTCERLLPFMRVAPTVFISENLRNTKESFVSVDNYKGTCIGTEYLHSLGHRSILYLPRKSGSITHEMRFSGYRDACEALGMTPRHIASSFPFCSIENGYILARELFASGQRDYTAIFAATDSIALGVMQAAAEFGIRIPDDISLMGFDNISYSSLPNITLSTIEQPIRAMAVAAVDMLLSKVDSPTHGYTHNIMEPSLVIRNSCRAI